MVNIVLIQTTGHTDMKHDSLATGPDLSAFRATRNLALLMPGEITGVLALVTFGTTKHFRDIIYRTFVPKRWQRTQQLPDPERGPNSSFVSAVTMPLAHAAATHKIIDDGPLGRRFGDRGSWTRGVKGLAPSVPLHDMRSPIFRDSVWRESTLSTIHEHPLM